VDLLAVLCNLYAEGPSTLRVLHRAGIRTLANVQATSDWALAELLETSPSAARRFAREAEHLVGGMSQPPLEVEEYGDVLGWA
jgi:hypothetical protein